MSGVNKNLLINNSPSVMGGTAPTEVDLITTSGSRYVLLNFNNTAPTSSGGVCQGITLEWSPDPSMVTNPFQPSSSYYAVTSSVLSCLSASLSPLTGSVEWVQFIDAYYPVSTEGYTGIPSTNYYLRAYQNRSISPVNVYSPVMSVQTRAIAYCGRTYDPFPGVSAAVVSDMDGWNSPGFSNKWLNDAISSPLNNTASFSSAPSIIKCGGPNTDALLLASGSTISWPGVNIVGPFSSFPNPNRYYVPVGIGIVQGTATFDFTATRTSPNPTDTYRVTISADASATSSSIQVVNLSKSNEVVGYITTGIGLDLRNTFIELQIAPSDGTGQILVDGVSVGPLTTRGNLFNSISLINNFSVTFYGPGTGLYPNNAIIRALVANQNYYASVYHCKYGPVGSISYVG